MRSCYGLLGLQEVRESVLMVLAMTGHVHQLHEWQDGQAAIGLGAWAGRLSYIFIVLGMAMGLAQLEVVLSASREPIRYQLKFILIGLGGLAAYHIYQASQMLLFSLWRSEHALVGALITAIALALVSFGLVRTQASRGCRQRVHLSTGSLRFDCLHGHRSLLAGCRRSRRMASPDRSTAVDRPQYCLSVWISDRPRHPAIFKKAGSEFRRFIARNFYRSKYDYRARWLEVTQTFQQATTKEAIIDCLFDLLIKVFPTTTISIWSFREADRRFFKIRPIAAESSGSTLIELSHPIVMQLMNHNDPVSVKPLRMSLRTQWMHQATPWRIPEPSSAFLSVRKESLPPLSRSANQLTATPMKPMIAISSVVSPITLVLFSLTRVYRRNVKPRLSWKPCIDFPYSASMT